MRIYIIGISGMLGNTLFFNFANNNKFQVRGSIRKKLKLKTSRYHQIVDENIDLRKINNLKKKNIRL